MVAIYVIIVYIEGVPRLCETATPCWDSSVRDRHTLLGRIYNVTHHFLLWRVVNEEAVYTKTNP